MKKILLSSLVACLPFFGFGQILSEGFDDITNLSGWTMTNQSSPIGSTDWFQGNATVFGSHSGADTSYIGANFNNTAGSGTISNWLITPTVEVKDGDTLSFWTRTATGSIWDDRLEVRSSQGSMTLPNGASGVGSFTNVLLVINDNYSLSYPEEWTNYLIVVSGVGETPVSMNFAFRYNVLNGGPSGSVSNFIGIDDVLIEAADDEGDDCDAVDVPYYQDFETAVVPGMPECTSIENAGSGNNWETYSGTNGQFTGTYLRYAYHENAANAWFYTQGINLTAGTQYKITYDYGSHSASAFPENLRVAYGSDASSTEMGTILAEHVGILTNTSSETNVVEFTPATSGVFYFGFNAYSTADQWYLYVDNIKVELADNQPEPEDGCLTASNGQWPFTTYTPSCMGAPEEIDFLCWADEYSMVALTAGIEYTFSTDISTDYITISDSNGTTSFAAGITPVTFTPTADGEYRFYVHSDDQCGDDGDLRSRIVQCGEPIIIEEPDFDCFQGDGITSSFDNAYNINFGNAFRTADDFIVEPNTTFLLRQITIDTNQQEVPDFWEINIREDNGGQPGAIIETVDATLTEAIAYATSFGDPIYHLVFDLDTPIEFAAGTYWLDPKMSTSDSEVVWWLATSTATHGSAPYRSTNDGADWEEDISGLGMVFFVAGDCEELGVNDLSSFDFAYYPNPVKDVLNIQSKAAVKEVSIFNLAGQKVVNHARVSQGQIDVNSLTPGTYVFKVTLENGQIETFKIVKK